MKKNNEQDVKPTRDQYVEYLTAFAHVTIFTFTGYMVYLCLRLDEFSSFLWHPLMYTLGWMLMMTEALIMVSPLNILTVYVSNKWRVRCHWCFGIIGTIFAIAGFVTVFKGNLGMGFPIHRTLGLTAHIVNLLLFVNGMVTLFSVKLRRYISSKLIKTIHVFLGTVAIILCSLAMFTGMRSRWFGINTNDSPIILKACSAAVLIPCIICTLRLRNMLSKRISGYRNK